MANHYFTFKKFTIQQDLCAMKVTTDSCLFGAWAADILHKKKIKPQTVLDIGAGTGLLSLMLAQQIPACYHALEINEEAYTQCSENFRNADLHSMLKVTLCDAEFFYDNKKYQFIISNPPFFENDLHSPIKSINIARHDATLSFERLLNCIVRNLADEGYFAVLLPHHRTFFFETLAAKKGFFLVTKNLVKQTPQHNLFRSMLLFSQTQPSEVEESTIIIEIEKGKYSTEFIALLKNYYLHF